MLDEHATDGLVPFFDLHSPLQIQLCRPLSARLDGLNCGQVGERGVDLFKREPMFFGPQKMITRGKK